MASASAIPFGPVKAAHARPRTRGSRSVVSLRVAPALTSASPPGPEIGVGPAAPREVGRQPCRRCRWSP